MSVTGAGFSAADRGPIDRLLTTTRSVKRRLDVDRPVDPALVDECLTLAMQAPSGGATPMWRWIVVTDAEQRRRLGEVYRAANADYAASLVEKAGDDPRAVRTAESTRALTDGLADVPVLVAACVERSPWLGDDAYGWASVMGSIFPAVWNFQLACRSRGLASSLMTAHLRRADETAEILGLPDSFVQACLIAVAHPDSQDFRPARRPPLDQVVRSNRWT